MPVLFETGLLLGIKTGRGRRYSEKELEEFWEEYKGEDLSNAEQIRLVSTFEWLDLSKLDGIEEDIIAVFSSDKTADFVDSERAGAIAALVRKRIDRLSEMIPVQKDIQSLDTDEDEPNEDEAESYGMKIE